MKLEYWKKKSVDINLVFNPTNRGQSYSRNIAAKKSESELLIFFDDDDVSKSNRCREHLQMYKLGSEISYVSSEKIYENGYVTIARNVQLTNSLPAAIDFVRLLSMGRAQTTNVIGWVPASTLAICAKTFNQIGGFDEDFRRLEDSDLAIRGAENGARFSWSDQICVSRNSTTGIDKGGIIETDYELLLLNKHKKYLSRKEYREGKYLIKFRSFYFGKRYFALIFYSVKHPLFIFAYPLRVLRFLKRVLHDYRRAKNGLR
jgi:glycosyltransferase involved in cell wall biosynthesis